MEIIVTVKSNYGTETIYPSCLKGHIFAEMAGTKTLTPQAIKLIKALGYTVSVAGPAIKSL